MTNPSYKNANLDQWIRSSTTSSNPTTDHLADFNKLSLNDKIQWPAILETKSTGFWLASSNKNEINAPANTWIRTHYEKLCKDDNKKWLLKSKDAENQENGVKSVTADYSQWLLSSPLTTSTTSVESLPGKRSSTPLAKSGSGSGNWDQWIQKSSSPLNLKDSEKSSYIEWLSIEKQQKIRKNSNSNLDQWIKSTSSDPVDSMDSGSVKSSMIFPQKFRKNSDSNLNQWIKSTSSDPVDSMDSESVKSSMIFPQQSTTIESWLMKPASTKVDNLPNDLEDWLIIPRNQAEKSVNKNIFQMWNENALHLNWNHNKSDSVKVQEWLKEALEEDINDIDDDFDESSIEIIEN